MSIALLRNTLKRNWMLLLIFFAVLSMYMTIIAYMFDPEDMESLLSMLEAFPQDLMKAMGFSSGATDLTGYIASWLYGMLMFGFPMVYCIILGNRLVAKMVDNGSFAYLLSTPNSRAKIIVTQGAYAVLSVTALFAAIFGVGVAVCHVLFPGLLDVGAFLALNATTMLVNLTVVMISFFFSCLFNETRLSLGLGAGIPIAFILMNMLGGASEDLGILQRLSIYGLYDPVELVHGGEIWGVNTFYIAVSSALFIAGVLIFRKKRLPL